jgi:hypothetical protein
MVRAAVSTPWGLPMPCNQEHKRTTQEKTRAIMKYCSEKMEGKVEISTTTTNYYIKEMSFIIDFYN